MKWREEVVSPRCARVPGIHSTLDDLPLGSHPFTVSKKCWAAPHSAFFLPAWSATETTINRVGQVMTSPARIPVARFDARHFLRSIRSTNVRGDFANIEVCEILVQGYRQGRQCG